MKYIFIIILIFSSSFIKAEISDLYLFGNMTKIKINLNPNSKLDIKENYFKRYIDLQIKNYPLGFEKNY
jgi:hypothetical protein